MRQGMLMVMLIGVVGTVACVGYIIDTAPARPRPKSYREAVERVLDEQHIDYRDIEVVDGCAPSYQLCQTYAGTVRVHAGALLSGQLTCRERWITCSITIQQAGIRGAALDDTIDPQLARWEDLY